MTLPHHTNRYPAHNPYARAQAALSSGSSWVELTKYMVAGIGALMVIGGVAWVLMGDVTGGGILLVTGVVTAVVAFTVMPQFTSMMKSATSMVDGLAANAMLAQTGIAATASIIQVQQTGRMINFNPEVLALVMVTHPHTGASYQARATAVVPHVAIPRIQPGLQVTVRIDPQNPMHVALVV
jgi:hypothetical protein